MGFFEKHNPRATRWSMMAWASGGALGGGHAAFLIEWVQSDMSTRDLFFIVPWMVVWGAIASAALNWQLPPDQDEDVQPKQGEP